MADLYEINSDLMFYNESVYTPEVHLDDLGFYRWRYTLDKHHDRQMYSLLIKNLGCDRCRRRCNGISLGKCTAGADS